MSVNYLIEFEYDQFFSPETLEVLNRCGVTDSRIIELALEHWDGLKNNASHAYDLIVDDIIETTDRYIEKYDREISIEYVETAADALVSLVSAIHAYLWIQLDPLPSRWLRDAIEYCEWTYIQVVDIWKGLDTVHIRVTTKN